MKWLETRIPPPLVGLIAAAAMYAIDGIAAPLSLAFPGHVTLALAIGAAAFSIDIAGMLAFLKAGTTVNPLRPDRASTLVTGGIFRRTRNPMYLGMATLLVAWAVYLANPLSAVLVPLFVVYMNRFQIGPEERALDRRFGAEYQTYRAGVRRWL